MTDTGDIEPVEPAADWAAGLLLKLADESGQKKRMLALDAGARAALVQAIALVALRKGQAYAATLAGAVADADGWIVQDPALAAAVAKLHAAFIAVGSVPMRVAGEESASSPPRAAGWPEAADRSGDQGSLGF